MKRFLISLLVAITLGLCAICIVQWTREAQLHALIRELGGQLQEQNKRRIEAEEKAQRFEEEIIRLTALRADVEARLLAAIEENGKLLEDQLARGFSIGVLMNEVMRAQTQLESLADAAGQGSEAIKRRNAEVMSQNAAIEKANSEIKRLTAERDNAITLLNERTREFNALVEKYNALAGKR